jgi:hypothetical protein
MGIVLKDTKDGTTWEIAWGVGKSGTETAQ